MKAPLILYLEFPLKDRHLKIIPYMKQLNYGQVEKED